MFRYFIWILSNFSLDWSLICFFKMLLDLKLLALTTSQMFNLQANLLHNPHLFCEIGGAPYLFMLLACHFYIFFISEGIFHHFCFCYWSWMSSCLQDHELIFFWDDILETLFDTSFEYNSHHPIMPLNHWNWCLLIIYNSLDFLIGCVRGLICIVWSSHLRSQGLAPPKCHGFCCTQRYERR
jgi:hypothetical protein